MKGILIIGKEKVSPHHGMNMVCISDDTFPDAEDGDMVDFSGTAKIVEHDGARYLSVHQVEGNDVVDHDVENDSEDTAEQGREEDGTPMDSEDALDTFMSKKGKDSNASY